MHWICDLALHGRGYHISEYLCVDGGRGGVPLLHCLGRAAFCPCSPAQVPSGDRVEYLLMPKAIDFTSISMRVPPGSREWSRRSGLIVRTLPTTRTASRGPGRLSPPCFAVERGRGRGIEGLPLLVREAAHHGRGVFVVGEEACSDGLAVCVCILSRRPSCRLENSVFPGKLAV
jgi:hypothetical protein